MNTKEKFIASGLFREVLSLHANHLVMKLSADNIQELADISGLQVRISTTGRPHMMIQLRGNTSFTEVYYESNILWSEGQWTLTSDTSFAEKYLYTSSITKFPLAIGEEVYIGKDKKVRGNIKSIGLCHFKLLSYSVAVDGQVVRWFSDSELEAIKQTFGSLDGKTWYETTFLHTRSTGVDVFEINGQHVDEHLIATPRYSIGQSIANASEISRPSERIKNIVIKYGVINYQTDRFNVTEPQAIHSEEYIMGERLYLRAQFNNPQALEKLGKVAIITLLQENGDLRTLRQLLGTNMTTLCKAALRHVRGEKNVH